MEFGMKRTKLPYIMLFHVRIILELIKKGLNDQCDVCSRYQTTSYRDIFKINEAERYIHCDSVIPISTCSEMLLSLKPVNPRETLKNNPG